MRDIGSRRNGRCGDRSLLEDFWVFLFEVVDHHASSFFNRN